jgi:WD40 repeat protein
MKHGLMDAEHDVFIIDSSSTFLITGSGWGKIGVYEISTRQRLFLLDGHRANKSALAITSDHKRLVSGDRSGKMIVWHFLLRKPVTENQSHT